MHAAGAEEGVIIILNKYEYIHINNKKSVQNISLYIESHSCLNCKVGTWKSSSIPPSCAVLDIFHSKVKFLMNLTSYILEPTFLTNVYHFVPPVPVNFHKHTVCLQENIFENTLKWSQTTSSSGSDTRHNFSVFLGLEMLLETDLGVVPQIGPSVPQPVVQSRRRPLLAPSPGWKRLLPICNLDADAAKVIRDGQVG